MPSAAFLRRQIAATVLVLLALGVADQARPASESDLAATILADPHLPGVLADARTLVRSGLSAGGRYPEVWIRDLNTFIDLALDADTQPDMRRALLGFFHFQTDDDGVPDGYVPRDSPAGIKGTWTADTFPEAVAFKNTVETDQETSLVQAVARYVTRTGDRAFLDEVVAGLPVRERLGRAMLFPLTHRFSEKHQLIWGATTIDWGDVQPETRAGVYFAEGTSHRAIDIYDNAMFLLANDAYGRVPGRSGDVGARIARTAGRIRREVRAQLWDARRRKFHPHLYLEGSPFPGDFDEEPIYYAGGTAVAIEAGLLADKDIRHALDDMITNQHRAGAGSIGLTVYPVYPPGFFKNPIITEYGYQNGGDWPWFGARMVQQLVAHGLVAEAYDALRPMVMRAERDHGFFEWYTLAGEPRGSNAYRGGAGQVGRAIEMLLEWAQKHK
jgi:hypothetical protein